MANRLDYTKSSKASLSSDESSNEESEKSSSISSREDETSTENVIVKKRTKKLKKNKRTKSPKNLSGTENKLRQVLGEYVSVNSNSEKTKNNSESRLKSIEDTRPKKRRPTKFTFPKSKSSQSGKYSNIKSRYLNVFKKATSTEEAKAKVN